MDGISVDGEGEREREELYGYVEKFIGSSVWPDPFCTVDGTGARFICVWPG